MATEIKHTMSIYTGGVEKKLTWYRMINGTPTKILWGGEASTPVTPAYVPNPSKGTGGAFTDTRANSFTNNSLTSLYHVDASHLSGTTSPVPLIFHLHGDGFEEYTNYAAGSTTSVSNYYRQVAQDTGALLIIPRTPDTSSATWWTLDSSTTWLMALYNKIVGQYNIDLNRVFWSGYSGGAEEISYNVTADYNNRWTGGGAMILGGGGAEGMTGFAVTPTAAFKKNFPMEWHVGERDTDDGTGWSAVAASSEGEAFYKGKGFTTARYLVPGADHVQTEPHGPERLRTVIDKRLAQLGLPTQNITQTQVTATSSASTLSTVTDKSIAVPTHKNGDLLIFFLAVLGSNASTAALPTGFTQIGTQIRGSNHRLIIGTRTANNEPTSYTPKIPSGLTYRGDILTVTGADHSKIGTPVFTITAASTKHQAPSVTPTTTQGSIISAVTGGGGNTWTPDPWMVEKTDLSTPSPSYLSLTTAEQPTMTKNATGAKTFTASVGSFAHITATVYIPSLVPVTAGTGPGSTPLPTTSTRRAVVLGTSHSDTTWTEANGVWWWQMAADRAGITVLDSYAVGGMDTPGAINGWSGATPQIVSAEKSNADLAFVEFGGNDVKNGVTPQQYEANLTTIANRLKASGKRVIFVFPPPLFAQMKAGNDTKYMAYRDIMRRVANSTGSYYTDAWDAMKDPATDACRASYDSGDNTHLNGDGQLAFGAAVAPAIQSFAGVTDPYDGTRDVYWFGGGTTQGDVAQVVQGTNPNDTLFKGGAGAVLNSGADVAVFYQIGATPGDRYEVSYAYRVEAAGTAAAFQATMDWPAATQTNYPQRDRLVGQYGVRRREITIPPEATAGRVYALNLAAGTGTQLRIGLLGIKKL